jgi:hypothetical protein
VSNNGNFTAQRLDIRGYLAFLPGICVKIAVTAAVLAKRNMNIQAKIIHFMTGYHNPFQLQR